MLYCEQSFWSVHVFVHVVGYVAPGNRCDESEHIACCMASSSRGHNVFEVSAEQGNIIYKHIRVIAQRGCSSSIIYIYIYILCL